MVVKGKTISFIFWLLLTATIVIVSAWIYWLATEAPAQREAKQVEQNLNIHIDQIVNSLKWVSANPGMAMLSLPYQTDVRLVFTPQDIVTYKTTLVDEVQDNDLLAALVNIANLPRQADYGVFYWRESVLLLSVFEHNQEISIAGILLDDWLEKLAKNLSYNILLSASNDGKALQFDNSAVITMPAIIGRPVYVVAGSTQTIVTEPFPWLVAILLSASISGIIIFVFYYQPIWHRLQGVIAQTRSAMKSSDFKERIQYRGSDDIAEMAIQVNSMLSSLEYCYNLMAKTNLITTELMQKVGTATRVQTEEYKSEENELKTSLDIVSRLSEALENEKVEIFFQPVFGQDRTTITGYEALARWMDEELGMVAPREFISLCEKSGLTDQLTRTMIKRAVDALPRLKAKSGDGIRVSLNLSTSQFLSPVVVESLNQLSLNRSDLLPYLEFEVKESTITHDFDQVELLVEKISKLGVGICIDDYGLGRYSLMYLQRIPVSSIKLSAAFTERLSWESRDIAFIEGIARFASGLGVRVIVKNIESEVQLDSFKNDLPIEYQGLSLSAPAPLEALLTE